MHRLLQRQLKKTFGLADEAATRAFVARLESGDTTQLNNDYPEWGACLAALITRVSQSYEYHERDLTLRDRSLVLSSQELTQVNDDIRHEMVKQQQVVEELKSAANTLLSELGQPQLSDGYASISELTELMINLARARNQAQLELEQQKAALDLHAIVSITDTHGRILYANDNFCTLNGYSQQELLGHTHELVHANFHRTDIYRQMRSAVKARKPWHGEINHYSKNGEKHALYGTLVPIVDEHNQVVRCIAIHTDITRQKQLEQSLARSSRFYHSITDAIGEGVYAVDSNNRLNFLNPEAERTLGINLATASHSNFYALTKEGQHACGDFSELIACINAGEPYRSDEHCFVDANQQRFPVAITAVPLRNAEGQITGHVGVFSNIAHRKKTEQQLQQAYHKAAMANTAKSEFLANMSHEIRTPMNAILGLTHLALNTSLTTQQQNYIEKANSSANALLRIINDILDFSKVEAGKIELELQPFSLKNVLHKVAQLFQLKALEKGLEFLIDAPLATSQYVIGDETRLSQVLINLVGNAIKFTAQGYVKLAVSQQAEGDKQRFNFTITDSGIGMNSQQQQRIFDAFNQADASISRRFGGTGLGMTITRGLIDLMEGTISLRSEPDEGTTFTVSLLLDAPAFPFDLQITPHRQPATVYCNQTLPRTTEVLITSMQYAGWDVVKTCDASQVDATHGPLFLVAHDCCDSIMGLLREWQNDPELSQLPMVLVSLHDSDDVTQKLHQHHVYQVITLAPPFFADDIAQLFKRPAAAGPTDTDTVGGLEDFDTVCRRLRCRRVLLVEDDPISQEIVSHQLAEAQIEVDIAQTAAQCLRLCSKQPYDCVIMDSQLPDMTGWQTAERLVYEQQFTTPIVGLSADSVNTSVDRAIEAGMCFHLAKPASKEDLLRSIDMHLVYPVNECQSFGVFADYPAPSLEHRLYTFLSRYRARLHQVYAALENVDIPWSGSDDAFFLTMQRDAQQIGANTLTTALATLLADARRAAPLHQQTVAVANAFDRTMKKVTATLHAMKADTAHIPAQQSASVQQSLAHIVSLLADFDARGADELNSFYQAHTTMAQRWVIRQAKSKVSNYDYEAAVKLLQPLLFKESP